MGLDELALCVKRSNIPSRWLGASCSVPAGRGELQSFENFGYEFRIRREIENDSAYKQIIPYILVHNSADEFLVYQRHGTEERLHALWSIGIGGHVTNNDETNASFWDTLITGMKREYKEETGLDCRDFSLLGVINEEETAVGETHLGLVFSIRLDGEPACAEELHNWRFLSLNEISDMSVELWSSLAANLHRKVLAGALNP